MDITDLREKQRLYRKAYYKKNKEKIQKYQREYYRKYLKQDKKKHEGRTGFSWRGKKTPYLVRTYFDEPIIISFN